MMNKSNQFHYCDWIKGICIVFVCITHFSWSSEERIRLLFPFWIDMAVPVFMIISGYLNSNSYERKKITVSSAYSVNNVLPKTIRLTIPYIIAFSIETVISGLISFEKLSCESALTILKQYTQAFINGGFGPGSYYFPIMIQFVFVFPLIYFVIDKMSFKGLVSVALANVAYEILKTSYGMGETCYRLLIFRYLFLIAFGCWLQKNPKEKNRAIEITSFVFGITYIISITYFDYKPVITEWWSGTSIMAALYIVPLFMWLFPVCRRIRLRLLEKVGQASYHIFFTQMIYYYFIPGGVLPHLQWYCQIIANIVVCIGIGMLFYYIEKPINYRMCQVFVIENSHNKERHKNEHSIVNSEF